MNEDDLRTLKHIKIYNWLKSLISRGKFAPGEKLPTETEIAKMFDVNRMTVRHAMDLLVQENWIKRERGKGTFLMDRPQKVTYQMDNIISFEDIASSHHLRSSYEAISKEIVYANASLSSELMLTKDSQVIKIVRVVYGNDVPMYIERSYFPYPEFGFLLNMDLNQARLYSIAMEKYGGVALNHSIQTLSARLMTEEEKKILQYPEEEPAPCFKQKNIIYDSNDIAVLRFDASFPGDKFNFSVHSGNYVMKLES